ncbi:hypothetical protein [Microlunatus parietis]|uniref:Uncharacterized protein n=1 Tax=Microlunatus parietis TaxID=682979 RepID=A0A7Y9I3Z5_9ACTN|nr:hypothetical protein [Microlunatus parietis]NYE69454.1 hypothetical protein [Microlunatus parietis]
MTTTTARVTAATIDVRPRGWALVIAGLTGTAAGVFLAFVPPAVGADRYSFPLSPPGYTAIQAFFFVHQVALAYGLLTVWRSGRAGGGRFSRRWAAFSPWSR